MKHLNRLNQLDAYVFSKFEKLIIEQEKSTGKKVLNLSMGIPDFKPSKKYVNKLLEYITNNDAHLYPGYGAIPQFAKALQQWYKKRFDVEINDDELLPLLGAKDGIVHLPLAIFDAEDEVLIPDPGYPAFKTPVELVGATAVPYALTEKNDFLINVSKLQEKISHRTKAIWVNYPSNPTGQIADREHLEKIVSFAEKYNLIILYDNAYSEITFDKPAPSILQIPGAKDRAIEIGSFSKTFSFAGFRMGWIVGNKKIVAALTKIKSQMDSGMSLPLQKLGAFALTTQDINWHTDMIASYRDRRNSIATHLQTLGLTFTLPSAGLYIWAKIPDSAKDAEQFCFTLLREKSILLTPGTAFGEQGKRFVRVSICVNIEKIDSYFK